MKLHRLYISTLLLATACLLLPACHRTGTHSTMPTFKPMVTIKTTPVKQQGRSPLCWTYAMLSTIESEHLMQGDSVNLSPAYVARMSLRDEALRYYLGQGHYTITLRGMGSTLLGRLQKYGALPFDSYPDRHPVNYYVLMRKIEQMARAFAARQMGLQAYLTAVDRVLDDSLGYLPGRRVFMLGAEYSPREFAHSVCTPGEYISLTSFTHHPFYQPFVLETPDNTGADSYLNIPLQELMNHLHRAIQCGHAVCWEGDISNASFGSHAAWADYEPKHSHTVGQQERQQAFERLQTTDDHAMSIVGMARHGGTLYYLCKNSWGTNFGQQGYIYLSENYLRMYTVALFMSKRAFDSMPVGHKEKSIL